VAGVLQVDRDALAAVAQPPTPRSEGPPEGGDQRDDEERSANPAVWVSRWAAVTGSPNASGTRTSVRQVLSSASRTISSARRSHTSRRSSFCIANASSPTMATTVTAAARR
jgi:hypothetical protein